MVPNTFAFDTANTDENELDNKRLHIDVLGRFFETILSFL
jgi:hypothetical protein